MESKKNNDDNEHRSKRAKLDIEEHGFPTQLRSLKREISPPPKFKRATNSSSTQHSSSSTQISSNVKPDKGKQRVLPSTPTHRTPFRLTRIADLDEASNVDTISLQDLIGRPSLTEVWLFDYLFDMNFVMQNFHPDIRDSVQVYVMHGSWNRESSLKQHLDEAAKRLKNVHIRCAYMPDRFGTHHSKMMVLFDQQDECQVVVHTANMIPFDWENMTQGAWLSPKLKRLVDSDTNDQEEYPIGSGNRFKADLLAYLKTYDSRTKELVARLRQYDFSPVRAAFLASTPGSVELKRRNATTMFGWPGLKQILSSIPASTVPGKNDSVVVQISSIATLSEKWANHLFGILSSTASNNQNSLSMQVKPKIKIIFPTVEEIRTSLNGWPSGGSIHLKGSSPAQRKQLAWLRPMFCRWGESQSVDTDQEVHGSAGRATAAPHIKTFVRYNSGFSNISWALLTSANLSTQAWGGMPDEVGKVRISSYETGVLVWPDLLADGPVKMVPAFGKDMLVDKEVIPLRLPYDLPLHSYEKADEPWCKTESHRKQDKNGYTWPGLG
jgi:tyrosyl-DNA phosphodiesterase 1